MNVESRWPPARCSKPTAYRLIAQAAAASRSHHCSGLIHSDRLRDEASDLGEIGLQVGLAARRVLLGTPFLARTKNKRSRFATRTRPPTDWNRQALSQNFPTGSLSISVSYATAAVTLSECRQQAASSARLLTLLTKTGCGRLHDPPQ
jgi:hypothetical protein